MKKFGLLLLVAVLALSIVACGNNEVEEKESSRIELEMSLEEIIQAIYDETGLDFPKTMTSELTKENMTYMLGVDNFDFVEGLASEPMMTSQAHSVVLFTVEDGLDVEQIKKDIKENVDGRKWICVGVEDENILVENAGQYVILIMDNNSQALMDAFKEVVK